MAEPICFFLCLGAPCGSCMAEFLVLAAGCRGKQGRLAGQQVVGRVLPGMYMMVAGESLIVQRASIAGRSKTLKLRALNAGQHPKPHSRNQLFQ